MHALHSRLTRCRWSLFGPLFCIVGLIAAPAGATTYELDSDVPAVFGTVEHIQSAYEDTLTDIARRYSLGYEEIVRANPGVDPWLPGAGTDIVIPGRRILPAGPREGIVINLPEHRLYYFPKHKKNEKPVVITYPVSIGKMDWRTPLGQTHIVSKQKNPSWYPPASVRKEHAERGEPLPGVVGPGPNNPLGAFAMRLAIPPGSYLIHGTNNPLAVGMAVTHGCMRMYPEDIEALFRMVPIGTKVWILNQPVKVAYVDGELLLEVHAPINAEGQTVEPDLEQFAQLLDQALGATTAAVHWGYAREALQAANGLPTVVGLEADLDTTPLPEQIPEGPSLAPMVSVESATPADTAAAGAPSVREAGASTDAQGSATPPTPVVRAATPRVLSLPEPTVPAGAAVSEGAVRTFPAGELPAATAVTAPAAVAEPAAPPTGTAVATAEGQQ